MGDVINRRQIHLVSTDGRRLGPGLYRFDIQMSFNTNEKAFIGLKNASLPISMFIVDARNDFLATSIEDITLPHGNLSSTDAQDFINTNASSLQATYDASRNEFVLESSQSFSVDTSRSTADRLLGFSGNESPGTIVRGDNASDFTHMRSIFIISNIAGKVENNSSKNLLARVPIFEESLAIENYSEGSFKTRLDADVISGVEIQFVDDFSRSIDFRGALWAVTLEILLTEHGRRRQLIQGQSKIGREHTSNEVKESDTEPQD